VKFTTNEEITSMNESEILVFNLKVICI